jgi:hypothetical protein
MPVNASTPLLHENPTPSPLLLLLTITAGSNAIAVIATAEFCSGLRTQPVRRLL